MGKINLIEGEVYGRLKFINEVGIYKGKKRAVFECSCGNIVEKDIYSVYRGSTQSCGCYHKERTSESSKERIIHGLSYTREASSYRHMINRCYSKNHKHYEKYYGGNNIDVCERWLESNGQGLKNFVEDMGERPKNQTLDRIDGTKGYSPENCRWADGQTQGYNKKKRSDNTSGRTGVSKRKNGKYESYITYKGEFIRLTTNSSYEEAVKAREEAEMKYYGYLKE